MKAKILPPALSNRGNPPAHYSIGSDRYAADWRDHLFVHEYGHYIQSQKYGPFYLRAVALPSLLSAMFVDELTGINHKHRWFETQASRWGADFMNDRYGSGAPGYNKDLPFFFNKEAFYNQYVKPTYVNPRTGETYQRRHPIHGAKSTFWDFIF